jgi:curved DNA-binding protein CbpA
MKYFKNIKSLEDLKNQFKTLARKNHPDAGGVPEVMKAINGEYDQLFPIWKHKHNTSAPEPTKETADSPRNEFYTDFGWKAQSMIGTAPRRK